MLDDVVNKKIKDAAEHYHPAYDEHAWDKMVSILNEHLPVAKKRKRKFFLILIFALLAGGSVYFMYSKQHHFVANKPQIHKAKGDFVLKDNKTLIQFLQQKTSGNSNNFSTISAKPTNTARLMTRSEVTYIHTKTLIINNDVLKNLSTKEPDKNIAGENGRTNGTIIPEVIENGNNVANIRGNTDKKSDRQKQEITESSILGDTETISNKPSIIKSPVALKKDKEGKEPLRESKTKNSYAKTQSKNSRRFNDNFAVNFSAGLDISGVKISKAGKVVANYGAGLSYTLFDRFVLRAGFYMSDKIYSANKNEYHIQSGANSNLNYLYNIGANCKVYEIPVTIAYNFGQAGNHKWFASAGLSSYLMKKESYNYYYKYPSGYSDIKSWSISNKNQHYFSILDISAGYEQIFNKRLSLLIEPYIKLPLSGVGAGKVKVNSGGVLFTLAVKPFRKK